MKRTHVYRSIKRGTAWLHGEPEDVLRRLRLLKGGIVGFGALLAVVAFVLLRPAEGVAFTPFLADFNTEYGTDGSRIDHCIVCHNQESGGSRNSYGNAWGNAGGNAAAFAAIENVDSDGDGASNITEILALTYPGNGGDTPPTTTSTTTTTTTTTTVPPVVFCKGVKATIVGTDGPDVLRGSKAPDVIAGLGGADIIYGLGGDDILCGNEGWDTIHPGKGFDEVVGGPGTRDVVDYSTARRGVVVTLQAGTATGQGADTLSGIEGIAGSKFGDTLTGNKKKNRLYGRGGPDSLYGKGNQDFLSGGAGRDVLIGGSGKDEARGGSAVDRCVAEIKVSC